MKEFICFINDKSLPPALAKGTAYATMFDGVPDTLFESKSIHSGLKRAYSAFFPYFYRAIIQDYLSKENSPFSETTSLVFVMSFSFLAGGYQYFLQRESYAGIIAGAVNHTLYSVVEFFEADSGMENNVLSCASIESITSVLGDVIESNNGKLQGVSKKFYQGAVTGFLSWAVLEAANGLDYCENHLFPSLLSSPTTILAGSAFIAVLNSYNLFLLDKNYINPILKLTCYAATGSALILLSSTTPPVAAIVGLAIVSMELNNLVSRQLSQG